MWQNSSIPAALGPILRNGLFATQRPFGPIEPPGFGFFRGLCWGVPLGLAMWLGLVTIAVVTLR